MSNVNSYIELLAELKELAADPASRQLFTYEAVRYKDLCRLLGREA